MHFIGKVRNYRTGYEGQLFSLETFDRSVESCQTNIGLVTAREAEYVVIYTPPTNQEEFDARPLYWQKTVVMPHSQWSADANLDLLDGKELKPKRRKRSK